MRQISKYSLAAVVLVLISVTLAIAGPTTGTPPYRSFGGGPDVINLGNLNVHYSFPVFSRAGRGIPFSYALAYDSSVWTPAGSTWVASSTSWGLTRDAAARVGTVALTTRQVHCIDRNDGSTVYFNVYLFPATQTLRAPPIILDSASMTRMGHVPVQITRRPEQLQTA